MHMRTGSAMLLETSRGWMIEWMDRYAVNSPTGITLRFPDSMASKIYDTWVYRRSYNLQMSN
jgi:hypothetical protein